MDKSVGKKGFIFFCVFMVSLCARADDINLRVISLKGGHILRVAIGEPFYVEVSLASNEGAMQSPSIPGLENDAITSRSTHITSINGKSQVSYRYEVVLSKIGRYIFGPVEMTVGGKTMRSGQAKIDIMPAPQEAIAKPDEASEQVFLRLQTDKKRAVVGEKIGCTLQFLYNDDRISLHAINGPELSSFILSGSRGPIAGEVQEQGVCYKSATWHWQMSATHTGAITVPAYRVDFTIPQSHDDALEQFSFFAPFLRQRLQQKRVYSNTATIAVDPLPPCKSGVCAIGTFRHYYASINPMVAKEGEGMVLCLELEGDDVDSVPTPELQGLPEALRFYDSKNYTKQLPQGEKKYFEYIVQGLQPGSFEIPAQRFVFFDTTNRTYKELTTQPLMVTVMGNASYAASMHDEQSSLSDNVDAIDQARVLPLCGCWTGACNEPCMPWWLFILFVVLPLIVWLYGAFHALVMRYRMAFSPQKQKKYAWINARKALANASRHNACEAVYPLFMHACAVRLSIDPQRLSQDMIEHALRTSGAQDEKINSWNAFFALMAELAFFKNRAHAHASPAFFDQAAQWLVFLEERI